MDDIAQAIAAALREDAEDLRKRAESAGRKAVQRYVDHDIQRRKDIMNQVAENFYKDYQPKFYVRRGTLYNLLRINRIGFDEYEVDFDPSLMTYRNGQGGGEENLYNTVFRQGWHGGASSGRLHPKNGVPMWRYPYPIYVTWGKEATRASESPLQEFLRLDNEESEADANALLAQFWNEEWAIANGETP